MSSHPPARSPLSLPLHSYFPSFSLPVSLTPTLYPSLISFLMFLFLLSLTLTSSHSLPVLSSFLVQSIFLIHTEWWLYSLWKHHWDMTSSTWINMWMKLKSTFSSYLFNKKVLFLWSPRVQIWGYFCSSSQIKLCHMIHWFYYCFRPATALNILPLHSALDSLKM